MREHVGHTGIWWVENETSPCRCEWCTNVRTSKLDYLDELKDIQIFKQEYPGDYEKLKLVYKKDLWLMSTELCEVPLRPLHEEMCDFFIHKDPDKDIKDQDPIRERLLLFPRFAWKTTIDALDAVNWIVCFPLICIAIQTGDSDLAEAIVGLIKSYFLVPGWDGIRDDKDQPVWNEKARPNRFHLLYPEHCTAEVGKERGAQDYWVTPARQLVSINPKHRHIKDPTVYALSIESNNTGWRCEVMKNDDILTDKNTTSPARMEGIDRRFHMSRKLLPIGWGYRDTIGTRYDGDDTYGRLMKKMGIKDDVPYGLIERRSQDKDIPGTFKYLCKPAWWLKGTGPDDEGDLRSTYLPPTKDCTKEQCGYLDEELWPYEGLIADLRLDPKSHASQYLNNPILAGEQDFTREGMLKCKIEWTRMPLYAKTFGIIDLAYSDKRGRDFTVMAVGAWYNDALWVKDIVCGRIKPEEMAEQIVGIARDYPELEILGIEDSVGAKWLKNDIYRLAEAQGVKLPIIEWISLGQGEKDAKDTRIKGLVPLYKSGRLFFLDNIRTDFEDVMKQFCSVRGKKDIPDAVARLLEYRSRVESPEDKAEKIKQRQDLREKELYDMIYGQGRYAYVEPPKEEKIKEEEPEPEVELDPVTGLPLGDPYI
jgi:hypothetical protein